MLPHRFIAPSSAAERQPPEQPRDPPHERPQPVCRRPQPPQLSQPLGSQGCSAWPLRGLVTCRPPQPPRPRGQVGSVITAWLFLALPCLAASLPQPLNQPPSGQEAAGLGRGCPLLRRPNIHQLSFPPFSKRSEHPAPHFCVVARGAPGTALQRLICCRLAALCARSKLPIPASPSHPVHSCTPLVPHTPSVGRHSPRRPATAHSCYPTVPHSSARAAGAAVALQRPPRPAACAPCPHPLPLLAIAPQWPAPWDSTLRQSLSPSRHPNPARQHCQREARSPLPRHLFDIGAPSVASLSTFFF